MLEQAISDGTLYDFMEGPYVNDLPSINSANFEEIIFDISELG